MLVVSGEVDLESAAHLRKAIIDLLDVGAKDLVVDLREVEFLDSTGLGVLVGGLKRARSYGGSLRLVCTRDSVLRVFQITGLARVFTMVRDVPKGWPRIDGRKQAALAGASAGGGNR